jgi:hypothetical protein
MSSRHAEVDYVIPIGCLTGHWRRAAPGWADQRMRSIQPYWKGPDIAAIIERTYKLKP